MRVHSYKFGQFTLNVEKQGLFRDGNLTPLTRKTFEILLFLVENQGSIIKKQEFFDGIWSETFVDDTNLTQHIYRIRKILAFDSSNEVSIETIPKLGYRFNAEIDTIFDESVKPKNEVSERAQAIDEDPPGSITLSEIPVYPSTATPPLSENTETSRSIPKEILPPTKKEAREQKPKSGFAFSLRQLVIVFSILLVTGVSFFAAYFLIVDHTVSQNEETIAVLPFTQIGTNQDAKLQIGITDTIISNIDNIKGVAAVPTNTIISYTKEKNETEKKDVFQIGKELKADILITGTIQRARETARVHLRFYHVKNHRQICNAKFDSEYVNAFVIQDVISKKTIEKLIEEMKKHKTENEES